MRFLQICSPAIAILERRQQTRELTTFAFHLKMSFDRLIRFLDKEGIERYGNVEGEIPASELEGKTVQLVSSSIESGFKVLDEKAELVKVSYRPVTMPYTLLTSVQLLCPLPSTPIIICAGVNYKSHAKETKVSTPSRLPEGNAERHDSFRRLRNPSSLLLLPIVWLDHWTTSRSIQTRRSCWTTRES